MLKAGFGKVDITPPVGLELAGYGYYLDRRSEGVQDPLYARSLALIQNDKKFVLINCDLLSLPPWVIASVRGALQSWFDIPQENVMILCVHTHSGPATALDDHSCGRADYGYTSCLPELLIRSAVQALEDAAPVAGMKAGVWPVEQSMSYNRAGLPSLDTNTKALVIDRENRSPIAVASYGCHPVTYGKTPRISADYCGAVMRQLDAAGYLGIFLNGICGDVDPVINKDAWGTGTPETMEMYGRWILKGFPEKIKPLDREPEIRAALIHVHIPLCGWGPDEVMAEVERVRRMYAPGNPIRTVTERWGRNMLAIFASGEGKEDKVQVQALAIGDFVLVGYPYEPYTVIGQTVSEAFPGKTLLHLGNANSPVSYVPDRMTLEKDGLSYGAIGSCIAYGNRIPFAPEAPDQLIMQTIAGLKRLLDD